MDQDILKLGMAITLLAALISSSITNAETGIEATSTPNTTHQVETGIIAGSVARSGFTLAVVNREPKQQFTQLSNDQHHVYYFTELKGMTGQNVIHRWTYNGQTMAELKFTVGAPRWRVCSSKTLLSDWTGEWSVAVIDEFGQEVFRESFEYVEAGASAAQ